MLLESVNGDFSVCKLADMRTVDFSQAYVFACKTAEECSLLCQTPHVPPDALQVESGWKGLKIAGVLDFGLVGVVAGITDVLARAGVSVFVVSTYDTDYVFFKNTQTDAAKQALLRHGYDLR